MRSLILILALSFTGSAFAQLEPVAPEELSSSLTERIKNFYVNFEQGLFRQSEDFVDEESKELYYNVQKTRIFGHEIKSITWADDFRSARVMVTALTMVPMLGAKPVPVPVGSVWNLVDGEWYLHLTPPEERTRTPFGAVNPRAANGEGPGGGLGKGSVSAPSVNSLRQMISMDTYQLTFPSVAAEPVTQVINVKSSAPEGLNLELTLTRKPPQGLTVDIPEEIVAGDGASIAVTYDPAAAPFTGKRRLNFMVDETGQRLQVILEFEEPVADAAP